MELNIKLLKHQHKFVLDVSSRFLALVAGYGAGKTKAMSYKAIYLAMLNVGTRGALLSPTNAMAKDSLVPTFQETLDELQIPFTYTASPYPKFVLHFAQGDSDILIRSAENYRRLAGINLAWFGVDEADTIETNLAHKMWKMLISRLRVVAPHVQGFTTSTPEGYGFMYDIFVKEPRDNPEKCKNRNIIHASTYDNPYLEEDFIQSLLDSYPENLIAAYLNGQFTNLTSEQVYYNFDRELNSTTLCLEDFDYPKIHYKKPIHIGMDFNVGKCVGIVHVIHEENRSSQELDLTRMKTPTEIVYAVDEFTSIKNTEAMIKAIKARYPDRQIYIYPDSSGDNETTNSSKTDLKMLKEAGFNVRARKANPRIRNRVNALNAKFMNMKGEIRYKINTSKCPVYTESLETQAYGSDGKPDKLHDQDHPNDAGGYFIYYKYPIRKSNKKLKISGI